MVTKKIITEQALADNLIYSNMENSIYRKGEMKFNKGIIQLCARIAVDFIKNNRQKFEELKME